MATGKGSVNKVIVLGNLGQDPELKYSANGAAVTMLSIATSEVWKDSDGNKKERTEWHRVVLWRRLAEIAGEYLKKGSKVYLEGRLQTRSWEKDGQKRYTTEIVAETLTMLDGRSDSERPSEPPPPTDMDMPSSGSSSAVDEDDLPF